MFYCQISFPGRFCDKRNVFETLNVIVDISGGTVNFISEDKKSVIRLDLNGAAELEECLRSITGSERFQNALGKEVSKHLGRLDAINGTVL